MFKVHEMMGNFSKEVAMFESESEACDYVQDMAYDKAKDECNENDEDFNDELENQMSYFSIEDDGREPISEDDVISQYEDAMDEDDIIVCGMSFKASRILKELDPVAYSCGLSDYYSSICDSYYCEEME
jgi:hypothetical protein